MSSDLRGTPEYQRVAEFIQRYHAPGYGRPHALDDPQVSADGTKILVTGAAFDELSGTPRSAIYSVAEGALSEVTVGPGSAHGGRISPDGHVLAFLSDRMEAGVFQPFLLHGDRFGAAVPTPVVPGNVEYLRWSPDGRRLLLGVAGRGMDMLGLHRSGDTIDDGDLPGWHPEVEDGASRGVRRTLWIYSRESGNVSRISPPALNCWEADWCGPSRVLVVSSSRCREDDWYTAELTLLDVHTRAARRLLRSEVQFGHPARPRS